MKDTEKRPGQKALDRAKEALADFSMIGDDVLSIFEEYQQGAHEMQVAVLSRKGMHTVSKRSGGIVYK